MQNIVLTVGKTQKGERLDVFLVEALDDLTRSYIQNLIKSGHVSINSKNIVKPGYKIKYADVIEVNIPPIKKIEITEEDIPLNILYEDEDIAIIDKPQGMVVHPAKGHCSGTLVNALLYHFNELSSIGGVLRPGIVHRLDKDTSGLLLIAKTDVAHKALAKSIEKRKVTRIYWAIVEGNINVDENTIDTPIARHPIDRKKMAVMDSESSRRAITHFKVLRRFGEYTLVELKLETGRKHQLRVHMAHMGNPIVGDNVYGSKRPKFNTQGQALHAKKLAFLHPISGEHMEFESKLPDYFMRLLDILQIN